jgi:hypothetical protein
MESLLWIRSFKLFYEKVDALFDDGRIPHSFVIVQRSTLWIGGLCLYVACANVDKRDGNPITMIAVRRSLGI